MMRSGPPRWNPLLVLLTLALALPALALPALATQPAPSPSAPLFKKGRVVLLQGPRRVELLVEVADTPEARARGLMGRTHLPDTFGMLFVFEEDQRWAFWMKNTLVPLSIAFIDKRWKIVDIKDMAVARDPETGPFDIYSPSLPARYALEVKQGLFKRKGIGVGAQVKFVPHD